MEDKTSYQQVLDAYSNTNNITKFSDVKLYLKTELLPYILLNEESKLKYDSLDLLIDLKDIDTLREKIKMTPYYKDELDSKNIIKDGNDYGFSFNIDDTIINISPFRNDGDSYQVFSIDSSRNTRIKKISNKPNLLKDYNEISSVSLEYIMKNSKDADTVRLIDKIGYNENIYSEIKDDQIIKEQSLEEVNKTSSNEIMKNSLINFLYKAKMNNNKEISDKKLEEAIEKLHNQSYDEINSHLEKAKSKLVDNKIPKVLKKTNPYDNTYGLTNTKSTSYVLIIIGIIICLIAVFIKTI